MNDQATTTCETHEVVTAEELGKFFEETDAQAAKMEAALPLKKRVDLLVRYSLLAGVTGVESPFLVLHLAHKVATSLEVPDADLLRGIIRARADLENLIDKLADVHRPSAGGLFGGFGFDIGDMIKEARSNNKAKTQITAQGKPPK